MSPSLIRTKLAAAKEAFERKVALLVPAKIHPNHLTSFRLAIILLLPVAELYQISTRTIFWVVLVAGLSDGLDGITARQRHQITPLGTALDPIADKLFTLANLIVLWQRGLVNETVIFWMLVLEGHLVVIPVLSFAYRVFGASPPQRQFAIRPSIFGKFKMICWVLGFCLSLMGSGYGWLSVSRVGQAMIHIGLFFSAMALIHYVLDWFQEKY